ncbi:MAG: pilus assembly protein PilP [Proteobacteria bacterium]|nr:pilus assembly protein PilP [Pseudomonadota bacterium]
MTRLPSRYLTTLAALMAVLLAGCGDRHDELRQWIAAERAATKPNVKAISEPKRFVPESYQQTSAEPFSSAKLLTGTSVRGKDAPLLNAEMERRKEPLESYPLEAITMVGSLTRAGQARALVRAEGGLFDIKVGDHVGQNFGRVMRITESDITLREIVQDAVGEWTQRTTTLQLQEQAP